MNSFVRTYLKIDFMLGFIFLAALFIGGLWAGQFIFALAMVFAAGCFGYIYHRRLSSRRG